MINATDTTFAEEIVSDIPVLVDFWAEWCGPCKQLGPVFEELSNEYAGKAKFIKVDIDSTEIAAKFGIRGIPTILFFKNGEVVNTLVGNQVKSRIQLAIDTALA